MHMEYDVFPKTNFSEEEVQALQDMGCADWDELEIEEHYESDGSYLVRFINVANLNVVWRAIEKVKEPITQ